MACHIYLSLIPESLVVSELPAEQFGTYLAVGTRKRSRENAVYFRVKSDFRSEHFDLERAVEQCKAHADGTPKHSVYVSIYRVLERVPLEALESLYLATRDGRVLELKKGSLPEQFEGGYHLYQELCPVHPLIASRLDAVEFCRFITDPGPGISVPKICFAELDLGDLAEDPDAGTGGNLPYQHIEHIKDCLREIAAQEKVTKTVDRIHPQYVPFRVIRSGFFVGDREQVLYYPMPDRKELETEYYQWWRSASEQLHAEPHLG